MKKKVFISISGPPNCGKTAVYTIIKDALERAGLNIHLCGGPVNFYPEDHNGFPPLTGEPKEPEIEISEAVRRLKLMEHVSFSLKTKCWSGISD